MPTRLGKAERTLSDPRDRGHMAHARVLECCYQHIYESHRRTFNSDKEALTFYVFVKEIIYG